MSLWTFWRRQMVPLRGFFWRTLGVSMLINTLMVLPSLYMLQVYDRVMLSQNALTLVTLTMVLTFGLVGVAWLEQRRTAILVGMGQRLDELLASRVHEAALQHELRQPSSHPSQPVQDLNQIRQFITGQGLFVLFDLPWFPIYLLIMFLLHPWLGWLGLGFSGVLVLIAVASHWGSRSAVESGVELSRQAQQDQLAKLRNAQVIHAMGMLPVLRRKWLERQAQYSMGQAQAESVSARYSSVSKLARHVQQSLSLGAGAWLVIDGQISPGAMIAANILMTKALQPLDLLVSSWSGLLTARLASERLSAVLGQMPHEHAQEIREMREARVQWRHVTVKTAQERVILKDLSLQLDPGTVVGLVGPSGSGKSTLARVMLGLWPRESCSGQVLLDGLSVFEWDRQQLGPSLGYLPQEPLLMEGTLAQNIARFGKPDPALVVQAAQKVGIHELILAMPQGYDTPVGEAGQLLSGGQRQLVALAQAMYGSPRLVVLDEPNSNLDEAGERCLLQALKSLREQGCAVLLITHRPEVLQAVDQTWHLHQGQWVPTSTSHSSSDFQTRPAHETA